jgi:outer membrane protein assembly factor BamB
MATKRQTVLIGFQLLALLAVSRSACAQFVLQAEPQFELSDAVDIEDLPNEASTHLARVSALAANENWDEAVETLRSVAQSHGTRLVEIEPRHYVNVRDFCHLRLLKLPAAARDLYRQRVDAVADQWYAQGIQQRDEDQLRRVVDELFCSSRGDDALLALGDLALERGHYSTARWYWERISPRLRLPDGRPVWYAFAGLDFQEHWDALRPQLEQSDAEPVWLAYPDTDVDLAGVRARLALVSILEGTLPRAELELRVLKQLHGEAAGHLAGGEGNYCETLSALLETARNWPDRRNTGDWPTFAGSPIRSRNLPGAVDLPRQPTWQFRYADMMPGFPQQKPTERYPDRHRGADRDLGFHPVVVGDLVLVNSSDRVFAYDIRTGEPAFGSGATGQIYPGGTARDSSPDYAVRSVLSEPRFTVTVHGNKLFARVGSQVTRRPQQFGVSRYRNRLVCLDLRRQGALEWQYPIDVHDRSYDGWAFEGPPLTDGTGVYVSMRRDGSQPEAHLACFGAQTGQLLWRRRICTGNFPTDGRRNEMTHTLLTLAEGVLYYNTNLGAVAAVSARDGVVRWVYQYPRARTVDLSTPPAHFYRDLNPCIFYRGLVIAAPRDSEQIFALDTGSGRLVWRSAPMDAHPFHLLGVGSGYLIATGKSVWWLNAVTGRAEYVWPEPGNRAAPLGYGRGVLAGGKIYWPTREEIYVFDQRVHNENGRRYIAQEPSIPLTRPDAVGNNQVTGGNLVVGADTLLIATADSLFGYRLRDP